MLKKLLCLLLYTVAITTVQVHSDAQSDYHDQLVNQLRDESENNTLFPNARRKYKTSRTSLHIII